MAQQIVIEVPGTKISELEPTSNVSAQDVMPVVQGTETKKAPLEQVADLVKSGLGSAALKEESDFATPFDVNASSQASQLRDDAQNERIDGIEYAVASMANRKVAAFRTYALADAVKNSLPANSIIVVTRDPEPEKNGDYDWDGVTLEKSDYDPVLQSRSYTDQEVDALDKKQRMIVVNLSDSVSSKIFNSFQGNLVDFTDNDGNVIYTIDAESKHWIVGLERDIASSILSNIDLVDQLKNEVISKLISSIDNQLLMLHDNDGNIAYHIDTESKHWIVGLDTDVASAINSKSEKGLEAKDTSSLEAYSYRDTYIAKAERLLNFFRNTQDVGLLAPVPLQQFEQNFTISETWLNDAKISQWGNYIPIETPYGNDRGVVHPQIIEIPNKFMGYRYIVTLTGYTNGDTKEENPFLVGSNDLENFELLTDVLDVPDSFQWEHGIQYNSDGFSFYDIKTGEFVVTWRRYWSPNPGYEPKTIQYARRTKDGKNWTEKEILCDPQQLNILPVMAQAIFYDVRSETYHMYGVNTATIRHFTSKTAKNDWVYVGDCNAPSTDKPWHIDLKVVGDKLLMTYQNRVGNTSVGFKLGISSDFHNFVWADDWWNTLDYEVYKPTFLAQFNEQNQMRIVYMWTTNHTPPPELRYKLFVQATPYFNVDFLEK